ncbi:MAG: CAAX prenyl protease-related protein [Verrucomicrobia bacterium]|nr:CAAX prenyl protease-related protein [Verrucomicrobiota bacterium]
MKSLIQGPGFPFVAPFALFMGLLYLRQSFSQHGWWLYGVCSLLVFGLLLWLRPRYKGQDPAPPRALQSALLGLGAIVLWIAIAFRIFGAVLVVPIIEELFWRGFLMRTIIKPEFEEVPLGKFQPLSFYITTVAFAMVHVEYGSATLFALIAGWWFCKTKSLRAVIILHAAANLGLAIYVLLTKNWFLW